MDLRQTAEDTARRVARTHAGAVVAVLSRDEPEPVIYAAGATELRGGRMPGAATVFETGSLTKLFTATLLADAVIRDVVTLGTPVRECVPVDLPGDITLGHLATHTSGLPKSPVGVLADLRSPDPYSALTPADVLAAAARLSRRAPGGRMRYSNLGSALLGLALVAATGSTGYSDLVRRRICEPLGLVNTDVGPPVGTDHATGHRWRRRRAEPWHLDGMVAAGGLHSTATDLAVFLGAQLRPGATELGEAIELTQTPPVGLGWMRTTSEGRTVLWHNGATAGFRTFAGLVPDTGRAVVVLANSFTLRGADLAGLAALGQRSPRAA
ncbi:serine hydrolase domain-containing protein [Amycolatopsis suaedae]|uniref:Class A beta-lactamase-related serine hydrolase n=1 Tax=Amycolatopsis suaedae TaxID=2510978 RepID=A0A4Q7J5S8_9PSEU|nr:serine hydrolase domain-containing protein [Amycolatopsis suaedae]RZQ62477.1 class A beta-lactamase-related serine hydrolase [Amycolatopsis suaedae]